MMTPVLPPAQAATPAAAALSVRVPTADQFDVFDQQLAARHDLGAGDWPADTRLILIRHRLKEKTGRAGGKTLFDCPGYLYQALVTNLPLSVPPLAVWREYNGRAACEGVIKELDAGYGLPQLACKTFWATEAVLSFGVLAHNLVVLFERKLGWQEAVTVGSLRYWLFVTAGVLCQPQGQTTLKLAVPLKERDWWHRLWNKLLSPFPNCNAVENRPPIP
jgi:hypothetical protein